MAISTYPLIITLEVNGQSAPIKKQSGKSTALLLMFKNRVVNTS